MEMEIIGKKIKKLMEKKKLTIKELASKMEISSKTLAKKLKGEQEFYINEIIKIAEIFDLNTECSASLLLSEIYDDEETKQKVLRWGIMFVGA